MMIKVAFQNIIRHRVRAALSLLTIAGAIASIILFRGYSTEIMKVLKTSGVENQFGHVQIGNKTLWAPESMRLKEKLFAPNSKIEDEIKSTPDFKSITTRLSLEGLIGTDHSQMGGRLVGYDPVREPTIFESTIIDGNGGFVSGDEMEIILGSGLASRLKAKKGDNVSIVAQTVDGVVNAADVTVRAVFSTTIAEIDNQVAYIPIKLAQKILDTDKVENWIVRLNSMETAERFKLALAPKLEAKDSTLTIKAWRELSSLYNQVEEFYDIQNLIIQIILSVLTILAITNTVGMTVFERTGEIGTLRALGATQSEIIQQFMIEGFVLACLAAVIGSILGSIFILGLNSANVMVNMPGSSMPVQITASYEVSAFALAILCGLISTLIGTFIPAWRASRLVVVEALRRNL